MYVKRTETFENYDFTNKKTADFYDAKVVKYRQDQFEKSDEFWAENLPENINNSDSESVLSNLKDNKKIKNITGLIRTLSSGYFKVSNFIEFGSIWNTFAVNDVEGVKVSAGFRSFKSLDDRFRSERKISLWF